MALYLIMCLLPAHALHPAYTLFCISPAADPPSPLAAHPMRMQAAVEGLRGLTSLELEDMRDFDACHVAQLSALTNLTSLSVMAVSNQPITNAALSPLTALQGLRKLKWHAGVFRGGLGWSWGAMPVHTVVLAPAACATA